LGDDDRPARRGRAAELGSTAESAVGNPSFINQNAIGSGGIGKMCLAPLAESTLPPSFVNVAAPALAVSVKMVDPPAEAKLLTKLSPWFLKKLLLPELAVPAKMISPPK
jgi:hypothetical protein